MVQLLILYCLKYISGVLLVILISVGSNFDGPLSGVHDCKEHADNVHCADRDKAHDILSGEQLYKDVGDGAAALVHSCELCALFNCAYAGAQSCCPCHSLVGDPDGHCHDGTAGNQSTEEVALVDSDCNGDEESDGCKIAEGKDLVAGHDDRNEQGDRDEEDTGGNNFRIAEKDCGVKADIEIRTFAEMIVHDFFGTLGDRKGTVLCLLLSPEKQIFQPVVYRFYLK